METAQLLARIGLLVGPRDERPLIERIAGALASSEGAGRQLPGQGDEAGLDDPFQIDRHAPAMRIESGRELEQSLDRIWDVGGIDALIQRYGHTFAQRAPQQQYLKILAALAEDIPKKIRLPYEGEDTAERLAGLIEKIVLKKIGKLYAGIYSLYAKTGALQDRFYRELVETVNQYLHKIGVYTIIVRPGERYEEDILMAYRAPAGPTKTNPPIITSIDLPAYLLDYLDGSGDLCQKKLSGQCRFDYSEGG